MVEVSIRKGSVSPTARLEFACNPCISCNSILGDPAEALALLGPGYGVTNLAGAPSLGASMGTFELLRRYLIALSCARTSTFGVWLKSRTVPFKNRFRTKGRTSKATPSSKSEPGSDTEPSIITSIYWACRSPKGLTKEAFVFQHVTTCQSWGSCRFGNLDALILHNFSCHCCARGSRPIPLFSSKVRHVCRAFYLYLAGDGRTPGGSGGSRS